MVDPRTRKPPEGGSAKGARKAPAGSVQAKAVAKEAPSVAARVGRTYEKTGTVAAGTTHYGSSKATIGVNVASDGVVHKAAPQPRLARSREPRARRVRQGARSARTVGARGDPSSSDDPPPPDLVRLAAASGRLWAHVRRREARQRLVA
jgi:hypothetical protein